MGAGRPRKKIDLKDLDKLLKLHCTQAECAAFLNIDQKTLVKIILEQTGMNYSEYSKRMMQYGNISLKRAMMNNAIARNNTTMQIWLSKQYLGMTENPVDADECDGLEFDYEE